MTDHNREDREALIERARTVLAQYDSTRSTFRAERTNARDLAGVVRDMLSVFEQAHAPTGDERNTLPPHVWAECPWSGRLQHDRECTEPQAEPTDAQDAEELDWEYGIHSEITGNVNSVGEPWMDREFAEKVTANDSGYYGVRRRKAGPWEPVEQGDAS